MTNLALALAAGSVLVLTLVSGAIKKRLWFSEALACLLVGMIVGPHGTGLVALDLLGSEAHLTLVEQVARVTLALSVMSAALSLPSGFVARNWRALAIVLGPGTVLMWFVSAGIAFLALDLAFLVALLAGAILAPTDPVLARSIVAGKLAESRVPSSTRNLITAESGINDGLALPFVMVPLMLLDPQGEAVRRSFAYLVWEVAGALLVGALLGWATGTLFRFMQRTGGAESKSLTATTTALALFAIGAVGLLGADGILAVFVAGIFLNRDMTKDHAEAHEHFQDAIDRSFTLPVFILLGIIAPFDLWAAGGWPLLLAALGILLLRRLPGWLLLQALGRPYADRREAAFAGWFGPVGVAALFYGAVALRHDATHEVWSLVTLVLALSTLVHGISGTPLTRAHRSCAPDDAQEASGSPSSRRPVVQTP